MIQGECSYVAGLTFEDFSSYLIGFAVALMTDDEAEAVEELRRLREEVMEERQRCMGNRPPNMNVTWADLRLATASMLHVVAKTLERPNEEEGLPETDVDPNAPGR